MLTTLMLAATLCAGGKSDYAIAVDTNNVFDATAARELQEIFARSTGVKLAINGAAERKISIRTDKSLAKNESRVTAEPDGDVVIRGGGLDGALRVRTYQLRAHVFYEVPACRTLRVHFLI